MSRRTRGIFYLVLSAFCFAWMNTFIRLAGDVPTVQKVFFRNLVALFVALFLLLRSGSSLRPSSPGNVKWLVLRAAAGTCGMLCNFYAIDHLALADASILNKMSPFFAILTSIILLKEKLKPAQAAIVLGAFAGALMIIKPTFSNLLLVPSLLGLLGGFGAGLAYTVVRLLGNRGERGPYIVFFFAAFSCVCTLPYVIVVHAPMTVSQVLCLVGCGLAAAGGQFGITAAYMCAPAREISVYDYSQILFVALLGYFLFGQLPDVWSFAGYIVIIAMAVVMFFYNRRSDAS